MTTITFTVHGDPVQQGSKRHIGKRSIDDNAAKLKPWRATVTNAAAEAAHGATLTGPLWVTLTFKMRRPAGHYRTGVNQHLLRPAAPFFPAGKPDIDKLCRSILDSLTESGVIEDDARVVSLVASKVYAGRGNPTGVVVHVQECLEGVDR